MEASEAQDLVAKCEAAMPALREESSAPPTTRRIASLWGGMGAVYEIAKGGGGKACSFVAKRIQLPQKSAGLSVGDERKRAS